jgi:hypothetical protein
VELGDHGLEHQADVRPQRSLKRPGVRCLQPRTAATGRHGVSQRGRDAIMCPTRVRQRQNALGVQTRTSVRQAASTWNHWFMRWDTALSDSGIWVLELVPTHTSMIAGTSR